MSILIKEKNFIPRMNSEDFHLIQTLHFAVIPIIIEIVLNFKFDFVSDNL